MDSGHVVAHVERHQAKSENADLTAKKIQLVRQRRSRLLERVAHELRIAKELPDISVAVFAGEHALETMLHERKLLAIRLVHESSFQAARMRRKRPAVRMQRR